MRGHLQQRGGDAWRIKVYVGRSTDGRKRYVERTVRGTKRAAEAELARGRRWTTCAIPRRVRRPR